MTPRIPLTSPTPGYLDIPDTSGYSPEYYQAFGRVYGELGKLNGVDPITMEVTRLRNARYQGCKRCMGLRSIAAHDAGVSEDLLQSALQPEAGPMDEEQTAAVHLADAHLATPWEVPDVVKKELKENFSSAQIVELVLRLSQWSNNKAMIALGLDLDESRYQLY